MSSRNWIIIAIVVLVGAFVAWQTLGGDTAAPATDEAPATEEAPATSG